ncbi:MAG: hypothetical protein MN733_03240 [Nitrososphaera sp.]|nr:hypothetical protein [Nitrososphaera sp.]
MPAGDPLGYLPPEIRAVLQKALQGPAGPLQRPAIPDIMGAAGAVGGALSRPAIPDVQMLINKLTGGSLGAGGGVPRPGMSMGVMPSNLDEVMRQVLGGGGVGAAASGVGAAASPVPPRKVKTERITPPKTESPQGKKETKAAEERPMKKKAKKKKKSPSTRERMADDMIAADRAGEEVSKFVRK